MTLKMNSRVVKLEVITDEIRNSLNNQNAKLDKILGIQQKQAITQQKQIDAASSLKNRFDTHKKEHAETTGRIWGLVTAVVGSFALSIWNLLHN